MTNFMQLTYLLIFIWLPTLLNASPVSFAYCTKPRTLKHALKLFTSRC